MNGLLTMTALAGLGEGDALPSEAALGGAGATVPAGGVRRGGEGSPGREEAENLFALVLETLVAVAPASFRPAAGMPGEPEEVLRPVAAAAAATEGASPAAGVPPAAPASRQAEGSAPPPAVPRAAEGDGLAAAPADAAVPGSLPLPAGEAVPASLPLPAGAAELGSLPLPAGAAAGGSPRAAGSELPATTPLRGEPVEKGGPPFPSANSAAEPAGDASPLTLSPAGGGVPGEAAGTVPGAGEGGRRVPAGGEGARAASTAGGADETPARRAFSGAKEAGASGFPVSGGGPGPRAGAEMPGGEGRGGAADGRAGHGGAAPEVQTGPRPVTPAAEEPRGAIPPEGEAVPRGEAASATAGGETVSATAGGETASARAGGEKTFAASGGEAAPPRDGGRTGGAPGPLPVGPETAMAAPPARGAEAALGERWQDAGSPHGPAPQGLAERVAMAELFPRLVRALTWEAAGDGRRRVTLHLVPEHLGRVQVDMVLRGADLQASFTVDRPDVALAIQQQLGDLGSVLRQHGLQVGYLAVALAGAGGEGSGGGRPRAEERAAGLGGPRPGPGRRPGALGLPAARDAPAWMAGMPLLDMLA